MPPSPGVSRRPRGRRAFRLWHVLPVVVALGVVIGGARLARHGSASTASRESDPTLVKEETTPRVEVVRPKAGGVPRNAAQPGSVHSFESVDLYAMVSGYLKTQEVDIGSRVKSGQVLAEIGVPRVERAADEESALIVQAEAQERQAEARVKAMEANRQTAAATVAQTRADVERTVARRALAEKQLARVKSLYERRAIEQRVVDEYRSEHDTSVAAEQVARLAIQTAEAQLAGAAAKVDEARADVAEAKAAKRVAQARLAKVQVDLDYARIVAPFDGVVTFRGFHPGSFIHSATEGGDAPLLRVVRTDLMRVVVLIPDRDVVYANPGDPAVVNVDALGREAFRGVVARVAESEDPTTRTMRVEIDLPNPEGKIRTGMYGRATIGLESHPDRLTVPVPCILDRSKDGNGAVRIVRDGRVRQVKVELGADDGNSVEVLSGLSADDEVVLRSSTPVEEGAAVVAQAAG